MSCFWEALSVLTLNTLMFAAEGAHPQRWLYFLHGILGQGRNFFSLAKAFCERHSSWGVVLPDLRQHGRSQGFPPPHTLQSAADDVRALDTTLVPITAVAGHSFGGKVALELATSPTPSLEEVIVLDSTPRPVYASRAVETLLRYMKDVPMPQPSRDAVKRLLLARGVPAPVATWAVTNLVGDGRSYVWRLDFQSLEALLVAYRDADYGALLSTPPQGVGLHFIKAESSDLMTQDVVNEILQAGFLSPQITWHELPRAGHWLHVDNPEGLLSLLEETLPL